MTTVPAFAASSSLRRRAVCTCLALLTILLGLGLRLVPVGLPNSVVKWGGSVLWAFMVYFLVAAAQPVRSPRWIALVGYVVSALVETSRLIHSPSLDAFRLTLAGKLLLGRVFSWGHFLVYAAAIVAAALIDSWRICGETLPALPSSELS